MFKCDKCGYCCKTVSTNEIYRELEGKKPYLKAVSFLGASIPQVKGMKAVEFKEGESDVYEFTAQIEDEDDETSNAEEIQELKDTISDLETQIAKFKEDAKNKETIKLIIAGVPLVAQQKQI